MIIIDVVGAAAVADDGNGSLYSCNSEGNGCEDGVTVGKHLRMFFQKMGGIFPLDEIRQGDCNVSAIVAKGIKLEERRRMVEILFGERERERESNSASLLRSERSNIYLRLPLLSLFKAFVARIIQSHHY